MQADNHELYRQNVRAVPADTPVTGSTCSLLFATDLILEETLVLQINYNAGYNTIRISHKDVSQMITYYSSSQQGLHV